MSEFNLSVLLTDPLSLPNPLLLCMEAGEIYGVFIETAPVNQSECLSFYFDRLSFLRYTSLFRGPPANPPFAETHSKWTRDLDFILSLGGSLTLSRIIGPVAYATRMIAYSIILSQLTRMQDFSSWPPEFIREYWLDVTEAFGMPRRLYSSEWLHNQFCIDADSPMVDPEMADPFFNDDYYYLNFPGSDGFLPLDPLNPLHFEWMLYRIKGLRYDALRLSAFFP
jgi:hypothetical protein